MNIKENIITLIYALVIAIFIRSFFFQPFYIPSSSMEPNLLVGDRLFVTKFSYGYSKHSFPFSPPIISDRILSKINEIKEFNIGHFVIGESIFNGFKQTIKKFIRIIN